jgi:hypothetical protein
MKDSREQKRQQMVARWFTAADSEHHTTDNKEQRIDSRQHARQERSTKAGRKHDESGLDR